MRGKKKKTGKMETGKRATSKVESANDRRVKEDPPRYGVLGQRASTSNAQRSTPNVQLSRNPRFDLEERLLEFSARIIRLVDALPNTRAASHIAGQLLRCGTSPYGNHGEVEAAESRRDFIHKLKICLKELKETRRWLRLAGKAAMIPLPKLAAILSETEELIKIFFTSIRTAEKNTK
jgi:four helix bundle protein